MNGLSNSEAGGRISKNPGLKVNCQPLFSTSVVKTDYVLGVTECIHVYYTWVP